MKLTMETDYAYRIVDYLIRDCEFARAADISEAADIPLRFAKNILQKLVNKGIINSYKGIYGGYKLGKLPKDISLYDVFEATQGPISLSHCSVNEKECTCVLGNKCPYHEIFMQLSLDIESKLRRINLSSVIEDCMKEEREDECCGVASAFIKNYNGSK